ncbi:MAG TPA: SdrD B-like domain-containing protein [bacterium]|nr:SdrD B-like domain-containing protein [bacterium]
MKPNLLRNARTGERGFSAVEALVTLVVFAVIAVVAITTFQQGAKVSRTATIQGDSQQSARVGMDLMTSDLRTLGFDLQLGAGQRALVYGGPWDIIFNTNITPGPDDLVNPGFPRAMNVNMNPATVAGLYTPTRSYGAAETIRYTLDTDGDGAVTAADNGDDPEEATPNPRDFVLLKEVYGELADGSNGGQGEPVAVVRGPQADAANVLPRPLFQYWIDDDDDASTAEILHGDGDADGVLSQAEIAALTPVAATNLPLVTRVVVTLTAEDGENLGKGDEYRTRELVTSVSFRNSIRRAAIIAGYVFQDGDGDGVYDPTTEAPIQGVTVRLDIGTTATSDATGQYTFKVTPGNYTVTEFDPAGYTSTTPNAVSLSVITGGTAALDFGDRPGTGVGTIQGHVYEDADKDQAMGSGERGLPGIVVSLHTGVADTTDSNGFYDFAVPVGSYSVVETDSTGWISTTPNNVSAVLALDGDVVTVDFGDIYAGAVGTITGTVYDDQNMDKIFDPATESGIADVPIVIIGSTSTDSTTSNGSGVYNINVPAGIYHILEYDPAGYTSTTPNTVLNVLVLADSTATVDFGDMLQTNLNFTVVTVGQTDRALSIGSYDFVEDNKNDPDIVLGTELGGGFTNLHVWHNQRKNSGTALAGLFGASPSFSRNTGAPIPVLLESDVNYDGTPDVITGLDVTTGSNLQTWVTITASGGTKGMFNNTPSAIYSVTSGSSVLAATEGRWPGYSTRALIVGTKDATGRGHVEVWRSLGNGAYSHLTSSDLYFDAVGGLGEVTAIAAEDFNRDGTVDLAVAQDLGNGTGKVSLFWGDSASGPYTFLPKYELATTGPVLCMTSVDMEEDNGNDVDLLIGTTKGTGTYAGSVELFLNDGSGALGLNAGGRIVHDDWIDAGGDVLSIQTALLDPDVFPDLIVGTRTNQYAGELLVFNGIGYLPSTGTAWSHNASGEVVTTTVDDYNIDGLYDVAVGTRTSSVTGELVVYFGQ